MLKVGDKVMCGVYVLNEWKPMHPGVIKSQSNDGSVSWVDIMSLHGGAPRVHAEATSHLRLFEDYTRALKEDRDAE